MKHNTYYGIVTAGEMDWTVYIENTTGRQLFTEHAAHNAGFNISDGMTWGYNGSGPCQLAAAILLEETESPAFVQQWLDQFCHEVIAAFDKDRPFRLTSGQVAEWCDERKTVTSGCNHHRKDW